MRRAIALVAAAAAVLAGCGGDAGELLAITTSGGGGDNHRYVVTADGRGSCDRGEVQQLPSDLTLDAREVERRLRKLAKERASFTEGPPGARRYVMVNDDGIVTWVEGARDAPEVVAKGIVLVQSLKRELCPGPESQAP